MINNISVTSVSQYGFDSDMKARIGANMLFTDVMNRGKRINFLRKLLGKQNKLQALSKIVKNKKPVQNHTKTVVTVPLEKIVGSEGRVHDFDNHFRPLVNHIRERWAGIALAHRRDINLPPVELIEIDDEYFVRDGHHRISVAKAFGQATIEAKIVCKLA